MKSVLTLALVVLISAVFISGCIQDGTLSPGGNTQGGGEITRTEKESQAMNAIDGEMQTAIESATLEDLQNELLSQG